MRTDVILAGTKYGEWWVKAKRRRELQKYFVYDTETQMRPTKNSDGTCAICQDTAARNTQHSKSCTHKMHKVCYFELEIKHLVARMQSAKRHYREQEERLVKAFRDGKDTFARFEHFDFTKQSLQCPVCAIPLITVRGIRQCRQPSVRAMFNSSDASMYKHTF